MPHITIEHSSDVNSKNVLDFLPKIQETIASVKEGDFSLEACKARSISFDEYFVGSKNHKKSSFFHVTIKILAGRNLTIKEKLAKNIADLALDFLKLQNLQKERIDLSVDIVDMEREVYQKITFSSHV